jgi:hypothetical protein
MTTTITVKVIYDNEDEADLFLDALSNLDDEGLFPTGADIRKNP